MNPRLFWLFAAQFEMASEHRALVYQELMQGGYIFRCRPLSFFSPNVNLTVGRAKVVSFALHSDAAF